MEYSALHAFIDECGDTSIETGKKGVSDFFVVTAVLVSAANLESARSGAERIRQDFFQTGEMKSAGLKNPSRRLRVLRELVALPFHTANFAVDKRRLSEDSGFAFKKSFFKNINKRLYEVLTRGFPNLVVLADEHGRPEFMAGFKRYMERELQLFPQKSMDFVSSKSEVLIQVADIFSGSLSHVLQNRYEDEVRQEIFAHLDAKSVWLAIWPPVRRPARSSYPAGSADGHDDLVRDYCLRQAEDYLAKHAGGDRPDHVAVLEDLCYRVQFLDDSYVVSGVIRDRLARGRTSSLGEQKIQEVVRNLRDAGVLIASGSDGYKIPTSVGDLHSFVAHSNLIVPPMLNRLAAARNAMGLASQGTLDILEPDEFAEVRRLVDTLGTLLLTSTSEDEDGDR